MMSAAQTGNYDNMRLVKTGRLHYQPHSVKIIKSFKFLSNLW